MGSREKPARIETFSEWTATSSPQRTRRLTLSKLPRTGAEDSRSRRTVASAPYWATDGRAWYCEEDSQLLAEDVFGELVDGGGLGGDDPFDDIADGENSD